MKTKIYYKIRFLKSNYNDKNIKRNIQKLFLMCLQQNWKSFYIFNISRKAVHN